MKSPISKYPMKTKYLIEKTTGEIFASTDHPCMYENRNGARWIGYEQECGYIDASENLTDGIQAQRAAVALAGIQA